MDNTWPRVKVERTAPFSWTASSWEEYRVHIGIGLTRAGALRSIKRDRAKWLRRHHGAEYVRIEE